MITITISEMIAWMSCSDDQQRFMGNSVSTETPLAFVEQLRKEKWRSRNGITNRKYMRNQTLAAITNGYLCSLVKLVMFDIVKTAITSKMQNPSKMKCTIEYALNDKC